MNGEADHQSEGHGLGSWHPAHMPESTATSGLNVGLSDNVATDPLSDHDSDMLPSAPIRQASFTPRYLPGTELQVESVKDEAIGGPEAGPHPDSSPLDFGTQTPREERSSGQNGDAKAMTSNVFDGDRLQNKPDIDTMNGLSFLSTPIQEASAADSSQHVSVGVGLQDHTEVEGLEGGVGSQQDEQLLPASGALNRTNSFPAVPPLHPSQEIQGEAHPQSQVESIVEEDEHGGHAARSTFDGDELHPNNDKMDPDQEDLFGDGGTVPEDDFFAYPTGSADYPISPVDDEARFEEGLPLVPRENFSPRNESSPMDWGISSDLSSGYQDPPDQEFFRGDVETLQEASFFKPAILDRKTTNQVLDGMSHSPHSANHDTHDPPTDPLRSTSAAADNTGLSGASMVSGSTISPPQAVGDSPAEGASQKEEDLAALWQAALDDDDLLEDNEGPAAQSPASAQPEPTTYNMALPLPSSKAINGVGGASQGYGAIPMDSKNGSMSSQNRYAPAPNQPTAASPLHPNQTLAGPQSQLTPSHYLSHSSSAPAGFDQMAIRQTPQNSVLRPSRPSMPKPTQSFADKSKGGYTSPYDLPMDVSRPKRRTNLQPMQTVLNPQTSSRPPAPPRSSSMNVSGPPIDALSPSLPPLPRSNPSLPAARPSSSDIKPKSSIEGFFEELPSTKSRPPSTAGRYAPAAPQKTPVQLPPRPEPPRQPSLTQRPPSSSNNTFGHQLVPPERQSPYANLPQQETTNHAPVQANARYSSAPGSQPSILPPRNRYAASPATVPRPPSSSQSVPFQPRTSSPLAQNSTVSQQPYRTSPSTSDVPERPNIPQRVATTQRHDPHYHTPGLPQVEEHFDPTVGRNVPRTDANATHSDSRSTHVDLPPQSSLVHGPNQNSPSTSGFSARTPDSEVVSSNSDLHLQHLNEPQDKPPASSGDINVGPPRRSQTQSPGVTRPKPDALNRARDVHQRPASAVGGLSYSYVEPSALSSHAASSQTARNPTQDLNYIRPTDGREHDPLERWKGAPIFKFGFGGTVVTSFPKHIPRYAAGHGFPMIKCSPGEVRLQTGNKGTLEDDIASFPGPLRSKNKKKELLEWLQRKIDSLERFQVSVLPSSIFPDPVKRHEEKVLLWKVMRVFVEFDGTVIRNSRAEHAVRAILDPDLAESKGTEASLAMSGGSLGGISKSEVSHALRESADPGAMESIRRLLLQGEREKAVWHAVDRRMWAHAMVLASTLNKSVWKQVLHEFTRLEVKPFGENTESLAALYEVFAGNWEESIDELVPPSARAGHQMVSKAASTGPTRNALDGLDKWRETLALILSNRTQDDENALGALGHLLAGYSRIEAAHLCFVFAKPTGLFGGTEDNQASVALLGADHQQQPFDYGRDLDSILLTEVYEFARSVLAASASLSFSPHLQSYKLYHAMLLAESGYRSEAQQYCDAIMGTLKSTTKPSPYYHNLLFTALDDLVEQLQQAPRDGSSWMSKPMDKMSGSVWKRLNNFIVGDENDTGSVSSGKGDPDAGPFARVAPEAATISRSTSSTDLYSAFGSPSVPPMPASTAFGSRYAPGGQYTPRSSLEQQGRPSEELQRPAHMSTLRTTSAQPPYPSHPSRYTSSPAPRQDVSNQQYKPTYQPSQFDSEKPESYLPTPPLQPDYSPIALPNNPSSSLYPPVPAQISTASETQFSRSYNPNPENHQSSNYEPPSSVYDPNIPAYEPPSSYVPYDPEGQDNESPNDQSSPKKKKSFMDDDEDDDFTARAAAVLKDDKARKDRDANEAFRKAAEADGMTNPFRHCTGYIILTSMTSSKGPQAEEIWLVWWCRWLARREKGRRPQ